jgi:hypothetical protein
MISHPRVQNLLFCLQIITKSTAFNSLHFADSALLVNGTGANSLDSGLPVSAPDDYVANLFTHVYAISSVFYFVY